VTITGADDDVAPEVMLRLAREFPRLEWGILLSASRAGTCRYPSIEWIRRVRGLGPSGLPLSAHMCGSYARALMGLKAAVPVEFASGFGQRTQVNGYELGRASALPIVRRSRFEYILQARDEAMVTGCAVDARARAPFVRCSILFDPSGGTGSRATKWPPAPNAVRTGYAGGISPANAAAVLGELREVHGGRLPAWIDMESGVRDARDRLDLAAVREVLEAVELICAEADA